MKPTVRSEAVHGYESAVDRLRRDLCPTLRALEICAADPAARDDLEAELPRLQYGLHVAAERAIGLEPLPGWEEAHLELQVALAIAREETAQVVETVDEAGSAAAEHLVWEWRGALFGVRLALQGLDRSAAPTPPPLAPGRAIANVVLLAAGVLAVLGGALADAWPVWAVGLALVTLSTVLTRLPA